MLAAVNESKTSVFLMMPPAEPWGATSGLTVPQILVLLLFAESRADLVLYMGTR